MIPTTKKFPPTKTHCSRICCPSCCYVLILHNTTYFLILIPRIGRATLNSILQMYTYEIFFLHSRPKKQEICHILLHSPGRSNGNSGYRNISIYTSTTHSTNTDLFAGILLTFHAKSPCKGQM